MQVPRFSIPASRISGNRLARLRRFPRGSRRYRGSAELLLVAALCLLGLLGVGGCASSDVDAPARRAAPPNAYLLAPTDGWTGALDQAQREALAGGYAALAREGDALAASGVAEALLAGTPDYAPALLLAAQADLVSGAPADARASLGRFIELYPSYRAARLLWARLLDLEGDAAAAHAEYRKLAPDLPIAAERAAATREPGVEAARGAVEAAIAAGRIDEARGWADRLAEWESPEALVVLEARLSVARAAGDEAAELEALRALHRQGRSDRALLERLAALELELGDADQALKLLQGLVADAPEDAALRSQLAAAQMRFRLRLLPEPVQRLAARGELGRGDFAALLYWMVPGLRQAQASSARIASDVLDHRWQQEIIRVVNRGLMRLDPVVHRFDPDRPVTRIEAVESAIEVAAGRPGGECARGAASLPAPDVATLCSVAARCGMIDDSDGCLPQAHLSGGEALELLGRALSLQKTE